METRVDFTPFQFLLYYFANFIGLAPFSVVNNNLRRASFWRKAYALILVVLSSVWTFIVFVYRRPRLIRSTSVNDFAFTIHLTLYVSDACASLLIFAFKSDTMIEILKKIIAIRNELDILGIGDNAEKNNRIFYAKIIATNGAVLLLRVVVDMALDTGENGKGFTALFWIGSLLVSLHFHNAILIFVETIIHLRKLFESLNDKLRGSGRRRQILVSSRDEENFPAFRVATKRRIADRGPRRIVNDFKNIHLAVGDVEKMKKIHGELCGLVESVTNVYTIPITFAILQHFSRLLTNSYALYTRVFLSRYSAETGETLVPFVQQMVGRTAISTLELFLIAHACTSICKVGNATKTVLHRLWNEFYPEELQDEFYKFSLQLMQKPVVVAAFGFFHLDYSYLYKIFCAMVAYFIIMMQLDTSQPNRGA